MKALCPTCGREGVVEQRGNSVRFVHYGYVDGKRVFERHTVTDIVNGNMGTEMGIEKHESTRYAQINSRRQSSKGPLNQWKTAFLMSVLMVVSTESAHAPLL